MTPLHIAAWRNSARVAELPLSYRANTDSERDDGQTPTDYTKKYDSSVRTTSEASNFT